MNPSLLRQCVLVFTLSSLIKLLTISTKLYRSTDFEVHRNWLAITYSLPFREWYREARNIWTLDYPPFFAYFEYILSIIAQYFDPNMLSVDNINYSSFSTILFQRLSVILISDGILALCVISALPYQNTIKALILTLFSSTLFIVDHVHFQYNGMMLGLLILATILIENGRFLLGASIYMFLVFFKHIYLYSAPVFFVFCLGRFVVGNHAEGARNFFKLVSVVIAITLVALVPLILSDQLGAALSRMFPFGRGLVHSYWAPNVWALYMSADRVLAKLVGVVDSGAASTRGLVQITENAVLPNVTPSVTFALTLGVYLLFLPIVWAAARRARNIPLLVLVGYGNAICFFFGWHIHEKAILMIFLPLLVQSVIDSKLRSYNWMLSFVSCMTLLPLLPRPQETVLRSVVAAAGGLLDFVILRPNQKSYRWVVGMIAVAICPEFFRVFIHATLMKASKYDFLPLMLASVTGAILLGFILCYALYDMLKMSPKSK